MEPLSGFLEPAAATSTTETLRLGLYDAVVLDVRGVGDGGGGGRGQNGVDWDCNWALMSAGEQCPGELQPGHVRHTDDRPEWILTLGLFWSLRFAEMRGRSRSVTAINRDLIEADLLTAP